MGTLRTGTAVGRQGAAPGLWISVGPTATGRSGGIIGSLDGKIAVMGFTRQINPLYTHAKDEKCKNVQK